MSERPDCPICGEAPVEWQRQVEHHEYPEKWWVESKPGEARYVCPAGHFFDEDGEYRGDHMPPDVTVRHDPIFP